MPSVTRSPFDDDGTGAPLCLGKILPLRRLPIDSTCLRLKPSLFRSTFPAFICALRPVLSFWNSVSRFPCVEKKSVPRFFVPFLFTHSQFSTLDTARFRQVSIQRARSFFWKRRDKACGLWVKFLCPNPGYFDFPDTRYEQRRLTSWFKLALWITSHSHTFSIYHVQIHEIPKFYFSVFPLFAIISFLSFYMSLNSFVSENTYYI